MAIRRWRARGLWRRLIPVVSLVTFACEGAPPAGEERASAAPRPMGTADEAERSEVTELAHDFMRALSERNTADLDDLLAPHARLFSIREGESGPVYRVRTREEFLEGLAGGGSPFRERIWDPVVEISGRIAMVWAPYDFYADGERSHCGIDVLAFMKLEAGWKVTSITYNVVHEGCPESPLGAPEGVPGGE